VGAPVTWVKSYRALRAEGGSKGEGRRDGLSMR